MHETAPIYLDTDASDYGIGAYLFQLVDGKEKPVAFMSRALFRDVHFCIRTDHKNLTWRKEYYGRWVQSTYKTISEVHNSKIGHFGVDRTYAKLRAKNLNWPLSS